MTLPISGCGSAGSLTSATDDTATRDTGSSRVAATYVDRGEPFTVVGVMDYQRGIAMMGAEGAEPDILTPEASFSPLNTLGYDAAEVGKQRWLKSDPIAFSDELAPIFAPFADSPTQLLGLFRAIGQIEKSDARPAKSDDLIRYRARLDANRAAEEFPATGDRVRDEILRCYPDAERAGAVVDFALDAKGRLRLVSTTFNCKRPIEVTLQFFDYGVDVNATPPPADEVMTHGELDELDEKLAQEAQ